MATSGPLLLGRPSYVFVTYLIQDRLTSLTDEIGLRLEFFQELEYVCDGMVYQRKPIIELLTGFLGCSACVAR
jgi:hypothetical protein